jgi:imidazolonepropionase-like amidohydrolase
MHFYNVRQIKVEQSKSESLYFTIKPYGKKSNPNKIIKKVLFIVYSLMLLTVSLQAQNIIIKAGHLFDSRLGKMLNDQTIVVNNGKILAVGSNLKYNKTDTVIDLSKSWVLPGLMDCHVHITFNFPYGNPSYVEVYTTESTALRALRGAYVAEQFLMSGFTTIKEIGNDANYATADVRKAIKMGWFKGPTIYYAGKIIGPYGGQTANINIENEHLWNFEYIDADNPSEIIKAIRKNIYYGANVIKLVSGQQAGYYDLDDIKAAVDEAKKSGLKVTVHVQGGMAARNVILGGAAAIEHGFELDDDLLRLMKEKGTFLVGTDVGYDSNISWGLDSIRARFQEKNDIDRLQRAYKIGVKMAYGTDLVIDEPGLNRIQTTMKVLQTWKAAEIPNPYILQALTINAAELLGCEKSRGVLEKSYWADIIALKNNPLESIEAVKDVHFVMKEGKVLKEE